MTFGSGFHTSEPCLGRSPERKLGECFTASIIKSQEQTTNWNSYLIYSQTGGEPDGGDLYDFNNDGLIDAVVPFETDNKIMIFISSTNPKTTPWTAYKIASVTDPEDVEVADINQDGKADVLVGMEEVQIPLKLPI